jgi:hypothetical protein
VRGAISDGRPYATVIRASQDVHDKTVSL